MIENSHKIKLPCLTRCSLKQLITLTVFAFILYTFLNSNFQLPHIIFDASHASKYAHVSPNITADKWIIVTTVNRPTADIEILSKIKGWKLLVIGDYRTPKNWSFPECIYLSVEKQKLLPYEIVHYIPTGSYTRKNIGYLFAIHHGAKYIYDTDDDNHPIDIHVFTIKSFSSGLVYSGSEYVMNPYAHFGQPEIWPRGFPLENIAFQNNSKFYQLCNFPAPSIQQGLVNGDPDVDAIYRLTRKKGNSNFNISFDKSAPPVILKPNTFAPYNSQNTLHRYEALWALFLPTSVTFRVTDIWRGYWAQRLLWLIEANLAFYGPIAFQKRNSHSYLKDFEQELQVYNDTGKLISFLTKWDCNLTSFFECVKELSSGMSNHGFWGKQDSKLIEIWIEDLKRVGYLEPTMKSKNESFSPCKTKPEVVQFSAVVQNESIKREIDSLLAIKSLCHQQNLTFPSSPPKRLYPNVLIIVVFNWPHYAAIPYIDSTYFDHFPNIVYCGYLEKDWNFISNLSLLQRPISFLNATKSGYFGYECTMKAIQMNYNVEGYWVIGDDVLFNYWRLNDTHFSKAFLNYNIFQFNRYHKETPGWPWWNHPNGKIPINKVFDTITNATAFKGQSSEEETERIKNLKQFFKNRNESAQNLTVHAALSDTYFVPKRYSRIFYDVISLFRKNWVSLELAVSNTLVGLEEHPLFRLRGSPDVWDGGRSTKAMDRYNSTEDFLHPVKYSLILNEKNIAKQICTSYFTLLFKNW